MQLGVGRAGAEPADGVGELLPRSPGDLRGDLGRILARSGGCAWQPAFRRAARPRCRAAEQHGCPGSISLWQGAAIGAKTGGEEVVVAHRADLAAEPAKLVPDTPDPRALQQVGEGAQVGTQPTSPHAELVDILRIVSQPDTRVVPNDLSGRAGEGVVYQGGNGGVSPRDAGAMSGGWAARSPRARTSVGTRGPVTQSASTRRAMAASRRRRPVRSGA